MFALFNSGCLDKLVELLIKLTNALAILEAPNIMQTKSISIFKTMSTIPSAAYTSANMNLCTLSLLIANFIVK